jgi:threonylcarbamoyladenosine tRNA methylthiotransferase MtaB
LQAGSDQVIKAMKRKYTVQDFVDLCKNIRQKNKYASITTDYIVGFPSETKQDFLLSCQNLEKINFADMHIFPFSARPFTPASKLPSLVSDYEKRQRFNKINEIRKQSQAKYLKQFINKNVHVLFEHSTNPHLQIGHSEYFFKVAIKTNQNLVNKMKLVKITKLENLQLFGELL